MYLRTIREVSSTAWTLIGSLLVTDDSQISELVANLGYLEFAEDALNSRDITVLKAVLFSLSNFVCQDREIVLFLNRPNLAMRIVELC
jgi:hypothetical protein